MTEAALRVPSREGAPSRRPLLVAAVVLAGRAIAIACALITVAIVLRSEVDAVAISQRLGIASILLVGAFARRSTATMCVLAYVAVFLLFLNLRPLADKTSLPVHYDYPITAERMLFLGILPTAWLQELFYVPGRVGIHDAVLAVTYITYFFAPHLATVLVWRTRPALFPRAVAVIALTFLAGLLLYFALPTAPPWLASESHAINEDVHRVMPELSAQIAGDTYDRTSAAVGVNDVAAMPSLHTALTAVVALIAGQYGRWGRRLGVLYVAMMGLALVYLGEHYVIDEVAGIALALGVWRLVTRHRAFAWLSRDAEAETIAADEPAALPKAA